MKRSISSFSSSLNSTTKLLNINPSTITAFHNFLTSKKNLLCLTGAGISTASGIPDYRGENGSYKKGHKPMIHYDFISKETSRKRYWTRSMAGFKYLSQAQPNISHQTLVKLEELGIVRHIITQNVDGLHQKAGSTSVLDLHGKIQEVKCLSCSRISSRIDLQRELERTNESFLKQIQEQEKDRQQIRADGDMNVDNLDLTNFRIPSCSSCQQGILKPNVVFFGDNVPIEVTQTAADYVMGADGLLVIGSSLEVLSAFRLVRMAVNQAHIPVAILNKGETRAEREGLSIDFKSDVDCGDLLDEAVKRIVT